MPWTWHLRRSCGKASRFGAECSRHGGESGAVVKVRINFTRAKYVHYDDRSWISEGYDACRAERTSRSDHPEWCLKSPSQVKVLEVRPIACGAGLPAFEGETMSLGAVRQIAVSAGLEEVYFGEAVSVVSLPRTRQWRGAHALTCTSRLARS